MEASLPHTDSGIGDDHVSGALNGTDLASEMGHGGGMGSGGGITGGIGPDAMSELLGTLSSEVRKSRESLLESPPSVASSAMTGGLAGGSVEVLKPASSISSISHQSNKGINVKEILKSLVAAPVEGAEAPEPQAYHPDPALKREVPMLPMQFHSFDR